MTVQLHRRTRTGNVYIIRDPDGLVIGRVDWIMAGDNVGIHCYSHDPKYKPAKIRKLFWKTYVPKFQMEFEGGPLR